MTTNFAFGNDFFPISAKNSSNQEIAVNPSDTEITVLEWFNKGCPFVKKFYDSGFMQSLQEQYTKKNIKWYTINSTKDGHPDFIKEADRGKILKELGFKSTEVLFDEKGTVGKKFGAKTTPHVFIYKGKDLIYSGAVDESPDADSDPKLANNMIINTIEKLLKNEEVEVSKTRPYGCSIKYAE